MTTRRAFRLSLAGIITSATLTSIVTGLPWPAEGPLQVLAMAGVLGAILTGATGTIGAFAALAVDPQGCFAPCSGCARRDREMEQMREALLIDGPPKEVMIEVIDAARGYLVHTRRDGCTCGSKAVGECQPWCPVEPLRRAVAKVPRSLS